ncbi:MAG: hypothetical protein Q8J64_06185 [Thermodesulfovibrionales bacterium]|nr:hypothetical protein [Thermodesulfovibrionales bacterium]
MKKFLGICTLLVLTAFIIGCGTQGATTSSLTVDPADKTAKTTVSFSFPKGELNSALLSDQTTNILVQVKQWTVGELGDMTKINVDKSLLTKASPSATLDLLPTYTRICASQYDDNPNNTVTSTRLESACTSGTLIPGANTVTLTMLRGTWTLSAGFAAPQGDVTAIALTRPVGSGGVSTSTTSEYPAIYDGNPDMAGDPISTGIQCYNDLGCFYMGMFKIGGSWVSLMDEAAGSFGGGAYSNGFNKPRLAMGGGKENFIITNATTGEGYKDEKVFVIGGFANTTDGDGWMRGITSGTMPVIDYITDMYSEDLYTKCWGVEYVSLPNPPYNRYTCFKPVLAKMETSLKIEQAMTGGTIQNGVELTFGSPSTVTAAKVNPCVLSIASGTTMTGCALTNASATEPVEVIGDGIGNEDGICDYYLGEVCSFNYKITTINKTTGADICYMEDGAGAFKNAAGATMCKSSDVNTSTTPPTCWESGFTYNQLNGRCEATLSATCTDGGTNPYRTYSSSTNTCTDTGYGYLNTLSPTAVTLTGVGSLPSGVSFSGN